MQDAALVVELGRDDPTSHLETEDRVARALILAQPGQAVLVGGREEAAQKLAVPAEEVHRNVRPQHRGHGRRRDLHRLGHNQPVQVAQRDFAQDFLALGLLVAAKDFQPLALEVDAAVRLVDAGGGHRQRRITNAE
ncbi:MAG: hypothetical protein HY674_23255 [Chloroflexi bacterium]|nr:hypothetical protein [Chloroflexota bacterium]